MKFEDAIYYFTGNKFTFDDGDVVESRVARMLFASASSSIALFITHPLDVLKLNLQVKHMTMSEAMSFHYMKDKSLRSIYKGVAGSMSRSMVYCNLRFELYELARRRNWLTTFYRKLAVASITGSIGGFFVTPMAKVHVRIQNDDLLAPNERRYYRGILHGLYRIYRDEGRHTLFTGSLVSSLRGMMSTIGQVALYDEIKLLLLEHQEYLGEGFTMYLVSSISAGCAATLLQQPFEVVSINILNASANKFKGTGTVIREILRRYGIAGFYKGLIPAFVRIVPHTVVTYMILENLRIRFGMLIPSKQNEDFVEVIKDRNEEKCIYGGCSRKGRASEEYVRTGSAAKSRMEGMPGKNQ